MNNIFIQNITNLYQRQGKTWLADLPTIIQILQSRWNLSNLTPVNNMTYHYVAKATRNTQPVVIKIGLDKQTTQNEMRALEYFNGCGSIDLLAFNEEYNALLLQQAVPGITLKSLPQTETHNVLDHYLQTMNNLHSKPLTTHHYPHISEWLLAIDKTPTDKFPAKVLTKAIALKNQLLNTSTSQVFLHGDLHLDNVLQQGNEWLAIDPKGVIGEPEFEMFAFDFIATNELDNHAQLNSLLDECANRIAKKSTLNAERIKAWTFIRLVLSAAWSIEDNGDPSWAINLATNLSD